MKSHTVYMEQVIDAPILHLISVLGEVELFKSWVPLTERSDLLAEVSHLRKLGYFRANLHWPLTKREMFVQASGVMLRDENAAVVSMSSACEDEWLGNPIERSTECITAECHKALLYAK